MTKCMNSPNFLWKIENYLSVDKIVSPALLIGGLKWQLFFSHFMESGVQKIRLVVECLSALETLSTFEFKVEVHYVIDDGRPYHLKTYTYNLKDKEQCAWSEFFRTFRQSYGQTDDITFLVVVTPVGKPEDSFKNQGNLDEVDNEPLCIRSLTEDFRRLFNNDENHDFELKCGEKSFFVHKAILSTRSEFFAGMFRSNMEEVNKGIGKIKNLEPDILELVLIYIYTGEIPKLSMESLKKVYAAADRLAVEPLKFKCHSLFVDNLITGTENTSKEEVEDQAISVTHQTEALEQISNYKHSFPSKEEKLLKELFMTREWRLFSQEFPDKSQEMCRPFFSPILKK